MQPANALLIEKPFPDELLITAIQAALARRDRTKPAGDAAEVRARLASLTQREKEVLEGLLAGHPNKTIAYNLGLSSRTVETHRARVMDKMQVGSVTELVRMAEKIGITPKSGQRFASGKV